MKRKLLLALAALFAICTLLVSCSDGGTNETGTQGTPDSGKEHEHTLGEWTTYGILTPEAEEEMIYAVCTECSEMVWKVAKHEHKYTAYAYDESFHWQACKFCTAKQNCAEHTDDGSGICSVCEVVLNSTPGLQYRLSADGNYAVLYELNNLEFRHEGVVVIADYYKGVPVREIASGAFDSLYMYSFEPVVIIIPNSVTSISTDELSRRFASIKVCANNSVYKDIDGNLYSKDGKTLIRYASENTDTSFTIPEGVTTIGDYAFYACSNLTSLTIPDSVTTIGDYAFSWCSNLTSIKVDANNSTYKDIDGNLYSKDGKTLIQYAIGKTDTNFAISEGVTTIGDYAFYWCSNLTSLTIPDSVTTIGDYAVYGGGSLTIYCEAAGKPNGWSDSWNFDEHHVVWGYKI